jgi:chitin deacetylase
LKAIKRHRLAKRRRVILRRLIFITLFASAFCFVLGLSWYATQRVGQTMGAEDSMSQASSQIPSRQETPSNLVDRGTEQHRVAGAGENKSLFDSPQQNGTVPLPSVNPEVQGDRATPPIQAVGEQPIEPISPDMAATAQQVETFPIPREFQAKLVKNVAPLKQEKVIALTFDDGPWPDTTSEVLKILKKNDIKATFFWIGQNLQSYPQIAQQVVAAGHAIANHTWHHWYHPMNESTAAHEIEDTANLIYKTTGVKTSIFRPPGGLLNNGLVEYANREKYVTVMWSVDSIDYRPLTSQQIIKNVMRKVKPGGIVLMHDGGGNRSSTVKALPQIIAQLKEQGYSFASVPELLEMNDKEHSEILAKTQSTKSSDSPVTPVTKP